MWLILGLFFLFCSAISQNHGVPELYRVVTIIIIFIRFFVIHVICTTREIVIVFYCFDVCLENKEMLVVLWDVLVGDKCDQRCQRKVTLLSMNVNTCELDIKEISSSSHVYFMLSNSEIVVFWEL